MCYTLFISIPLTFVWNFSWHFLPPPLLLLLSTFITELYKRTRENFGFWPWNVCINRWFGYIYIFSYDLIKKHKMVTNALYVWKYGIILNPNPTSSIHRPVSALHNVLCWCCHNNGAPWWHFYCWDEHTRNT